MPTRKLKLIKRLSDCILTKLIFYVCSRAHRHLSYFGKGKKKNAKHGNSSQTFQTDSISHSTSVKLHCTVLLMLLLFEDENLGQNAKERSSY